MPRPSRGASNSPGYRDSPLWSYLYTGTLPRLISFVSHSYENCRVYIQNSHLGTRITTPPKWKDRRSRHGRVSPAAGPSFPYLITSLPPLLQVLWLQHLCAPPRMCCKQKTCGDLCLEAKPFRCNTYKKTGGLPLRPKPVSFSASEVSALSTFRRSTFPARPWYDSPAAHNLRSFLPDRRSS
jgi:hypothetical protein